MTTTPTQREHDLVGEHAVVVGASIGGLLAASALAGAYERVTVLDRDALPDGFEGRRAVPQGRHAHALLPRGQACIDALLPGLSGEIVAAGAPTAAALREMRYIVGGCELARVDTGGQSVLAGRPFIEGHVRRRVRALENVEIADRREVLEPVARDGRVTGVRVAPRGAPEDAEVVSADLVVAATGRAARVPAWLRALGYEAPAEDRLAVDVSYASRHLRLPDGALAGDKLVLVGAVPDRPRALFLFAQEDGTWILSTGGFGGGHRAPLDPEGFRAFAATVAPPDVQAAIAEAEWLDDPVPFRYPASVRRRYERLRRFPHGFLVCGDAICSFNPTYGQGMSVAAAEAVALRECLAGGQRDLARRFFAAAARPLGDAWDLSTGGDLSLPQIQGPRPLRVRAVNAYLRRVRATARQDAMVAGAVSAVGGMRERPPYVMRPSVVARVVRGPRGGEPPDTTRRRVLEVDGVRTVVREAGPGSAGEAVVFIHGNPGSGADWGSLLAATGHRLRAVAWDAPGFGEARADGFPQTVEAHAAFTGRMLDVLAIERAHLVLHDFGGPWGLRWAAEHPERFASAVLINTGALPGYRWHALARLWRTPVAGELFMAATTRPGFRALLRRGQPRALPRAFTDRMYRDFDRATRRAVLELYRSVDAPGAAGHELAAALRPLDRPALVLWGALDPYIGVEHAERQREAFPSAEVRVLSRAGHWPFVDEPELVGTLVCEFLARQAAPARGALRRAA